MSFMQTSAATQRRARSNKSGAAPAANAIAFTIADVSDIPEAMIASQHSVPPRCPQGEGRRLVHGARPWAIVLAALTVLSGCSTAEPFPGLPRLTVTTQFNVENLCDIGVSPEIHLNHVPDQTANYVIQITDINVLIQTPWRETVPASSKNEISEGAAKTYIGPCIGDNTRFPPVAPYGYLHRVEVLAEDAQGRPVAYGAAVVYVESPYQTAKRERLGLQPPSTSAPPTGQPGLLPGQYGTNFPGAPGLMTTGPYQ